MQIVSKKGVNLYRDYYIDMEVYPACLPQVIKLPISTLNNNIKWEKRPGDRVNKFEVIAYFGNNIPAFSPVSGRIKEVLTGPVIGKITNMQYVVIDVDENQAPIKTDWQAREKYSKDELLKVFKAAGIINESFEDYLINTVNPNTKYNNILIDCVDEQPYDLSKTATFLNFQAEVLGGAEIIAKAFDIPKKEIIMMKNFRTAETFKGGVKGFNLIRAKGKYPISPEITQYAHSCTGLLLGAQCCRAVYRAACYSEPQTSTVITVWGEGVESPKNLEVPFGVTVSDIISRCSATGILERVIAGGVLKGYTLSPEWPVYPWNTAVTTMPIKRHNRTIECINCGRCAKVCPMKLAPYYITRSSNKPSEAIAKKLCAGMCIYCGACSYICPSRLSLNEMIYEYNRQMIEGRIK